MLPKSELNLLKKRNFSSKNAGIAFFCTFLFARTPFVPASFVVHLTHTLVT